MRNSIAGSILFALAFCVATGVDANPIQAVYALVLMGGALMCSKRAKRQKKNRPIGVIRDAV